MRVASPGGAARFVRTGRKRQPKENPMSSQQSLSPAIAAFLEHVNGARPFSGTPDEDHKLPRTAPAPGASCVMHGVLRFIFAPRTVTFVRQTAMRNANGVADRSSRSIAATAPIPCGACVSGDSGVQGILGFFRLHSEFCSHTPRS